MFFLTCNCQTVGGPSEDTGKAVALGCDPRSESGPQADDLDEGGGAVRVSCTPGPVGDDSTVPVLVSVEPPEGAARTPSDIVIVVDTSWSMSMEATVQGPGGKSESNGLSMLDVAKHAARTIIRGLGAQDRLALVSFCEVAAVQSDLGFMHEAGQGRAEKRLESLRFGNGTNLRAGIEKGFEALRGGRREEGRFAHMMVLTDGETEGAGAVMPNLKVAAERNGGRLPCTISTFGFGYEINSALLTEIADFGEGAYAFIPDAGFVGTVFVNSMGNLLVTVARCACLRFEAGDAGIRDILGGWQLSRDGGGGGSRCSIGTVQCGQTKDVVVRVNAEDLGKLRVSLTYEDVAGGTVAVEAGITPGADGGALERHLCRAKFVGAILEALARAQSLKKSDVAAAHGIILGAGEAVAASPAAGHEHVAALVEDICGQSSEAVSCQAYFRRWGRHYLPSVMHAHKLQQCNNFKDPGVQFYGGALFNALRDEADAEFSKLPAPTITRAAYRYLGNGKLKWNPAGSTTQRREPVSMAAYNDRDAGCIDGTSMAQVPGGQRRRVSELAKGDRVVAADGAAAEVVCVVRTPCPSGRTRLVALPGGARLTPYHPVRIAGAWCFPADQGEIEERSCEAVYNLVLRGAPDVIIGETPCAALGHGLEEGAAKHPYFGSQRVLEDLAALPGFGAGLVELPPCWARRDPRTGLVCGMQGNAGR